MAVRGDDPHKIMHRCGHKSFSTTMIYVREGEAVSEGFGEPFPPLPDELLENRPEIAPGDSGCTIQPKTSCFQRGGRDSNTAKLPDSRCFTSDSRHEDGARIDVSAREQVGIGPSPTASPKDPRRTVEDALALALLRAAETARWDLVSQLLRELEARRIAAHVG
jgi:hypothetical protein